MRAVHPFSFLACTYNLWGTSGWQERRRPLERFLELHRPDVLCAQELSPAACELIGDTLPWTRRVEDPFAGWTGESNVFWNSRLFEIVDHGAEDIGIPEGDRRLFWVRLVTEAGTTMVVATAHLSWTGNIRELTERVNVRIAQAEAAAAFLEQLADPDEPVIFMGDFNDHLHPLRILRIAGFDDSFMALGREPAITFPAFPMAQQPPELFDWMLHRGPIHATLTSVVDFHVGGFAPSDHKPVVTTYKLRDGTEP
ncbi:MAG: endonuclease/exonuclease/phosphatase family protein [Acidimicrobiia bacterium]